MKPFEKILSQTRRYYFDFKCKGCKKRTKDYTVTDSRAGLASPFGVYCNFCGMYQDVPLTVKYYALKEVEITKEEWERTLRNG